MKHIIINMAYKDCPTLGRLALILNSDTPYYLIKHWIQNKKNYSHLRILII